MNDYKNKKVKYSGHTFLNLPVELTEKDYIEAMSFSVAEYKKNKNVKAIYLAGGKWIPGISDLDIYVVLDDNFIGSFNMGMSESRPKYYDYIVMHRHDFFTQHAFSYIYYILSAQVNFKLLYGQEQKILIPQNVLSMDEYELLNLSITLDYLMNKMLLIGRFLLDKEINVRQVLGELYSLKYTFGLIESFSCAAINKDHLEQFSNLRKEWFKNSLENNLNKMLGLLNELNNDLLDIIKLIDDYIKLKKGEYLPFEGAYLSKKFVNNKFDIEFVNSSDWNKNRFMEFFTSEYLDISLPVIKRKIKRYKLILPQSFSFLFYQYALNNNNFGLLFKNYKIKIKNLISSASIRIKTEILSDLILMTKKEHYRLRIPNTYGYALDQSFIKYHILNLVLYLVTKFKNFR